LGAAPLTLRAAPLTLPSPREGRGNPVRKHTGFGENGFVIAQVGFALFKHVAMAAANVADVVIENCGFAMDGFGERGGVAWSDFALGIPARDVL
jgi:hypothetical protein